MDGNRRRTLQLAHAIATLLVSAIFETNAIFPKSRLAGFMQSFRVDSKERQTQLGSVLKLSRLSILALAVVGAVFADLVVDGIGVLWGEA